MYFFDTRGPYPEDCDHCHGDGCFTCDFTGSLCSFCGETWEFCEGECEDEYEDEDET